MNGLHRYGCNMCSTSQHAEGNIHEHATHWICPHCQDEVSVKRSVCGCGKWRPRSAPLINHGQAAEDRFVAKGAEAAPVVLNRRAVVNQGAGLGLEDPATGRLHPVSGVDITGAAEIHEEVIDVEDEEMGVTPQTTNDVVDPTLAETTTMEVDEPEPTPRLHSSNIQGTWDSGQGIPRANSLASSSAGLLDDEYGLQTYLLFTGGFYS